MVAHLNECDIRNVDEAASYLEDLIEEAQATGELGPDVHSRRLAFLINAMFERILSAYYTEHLARDIDLYKANREIQEEWITLFCDLVRGQLGIKDSNLETGAGDAR